MGKYIWCLNYNRCPRALTVSRSIKACRTASESTQTSTERVSARDSLGLLVSDVLVCHGTLSELADDEEALPETLLVGTTSPDEPSASPPMQISLSEVSLLSPDETRLASKSEP